MASGTGHSLAGVALLTLLLSITTWCFRVDAVGVPSEGAIRGDARERAWEETDSPLRKFKGSSRPKIPTYLVHHLGAH